MRPDVRSLTGDAHAGGAGSQQQHHRPPVGSTRTIGAFLSMSGTMMKRTRLPRMKMCSMCETWAVVWEGQRVGGGHRMPGCNGPPGHCTAARCPLPRSPPHDKPRVQAANLAVARRGRHVCELHVPVVLRLVQLAAVDFAALQLHLRQPAAGWGRVGQQQQQQQQGSGKASSARSPPPPPLVARAAAARRSPQRGPRTVQMCPVASCSSLMGTPTPLREPAGGEGGEGGAIEPGAACTVTVQGCPAIPTQRSPAIASQHAAGRAGPLRRSLWGIPARPRTCRCHRHGDRGPSAAERASLGVGGDTQLRQGSGGCHALP